jgi:hypothetical protein
MNEFHMLARTNSRALLWTINELGGQQWTFPKRCLIENVRLTQD